MVDKTFKINCAAEASRGNNILNLYLGLSDDDYAFLLKLLGNLQDCPSSFPF
jgi:hypothetical protein